MTIELAELEHPVVEGPQTHDERSGRWRTWALVAVLGAWVVLGFWLQGRNTQVLGDTDLTPLHNWLNDLKLHVENAKFDNNPILWPIDWLSNVFKWTVDTLETIFVSDASRPGQVAIIGWAGVVALATWLAYALAGLRIAILVVITMLLFGFLGYWQESMQTLILTSVSVVVSVLIGIPLAIWMSRSNRVTTGITPILDGMQTMPSFAYLAPLALLFGIGSGSAVAATVIYALPPVVRITAHALRTVSPTTVEATTSMGSTENQLLSKVRLPMSRRTIIVGLNQTIMAALSMATICVFIGAPGLGDPILQGLEVQDIGAAFVAGMCIVLMAIMLDRSTTALGERSEAVGRSRRSISQQTRRGILGGTGVLVIVVMYLSNTRYKWSVFPTVDLGNSIADRVSSFSDWIVQTFGGFTTWIYTSVTNWFLNPLDKLLGNTPWWLTAAAIMAIATILGTAGKGNVRKLVVPSLVGVAAVVGAGMWAGGSVDMPWLIWWGGIVVLLFVSSVLGCGGALQPTMVCLVIIFAVGLWNVSMLTLSMTLVAAAAVMVFGIIIGVWMGRSRRVDIALRPFLDALQTMPSLVYLIPAFLLFSFGRFLAIVAAVLYAVPVAIKIVADGIEGVAPTTVEAARAAGSSKWQLVSKVQLPMSKGSIVLAANQGLLFVLSMVVIGGLVGGGGLGFLVVSGFDKEGLFGKGLAAGVAITALGIMLDRITVHAAARYGRAETE